MKLNLEYRKISSLKPYKNNAKVHTPEQIGRIAQSIAEFGFLSPVVVNYDGTILAGHGRCEAAKRIGMEEVPTVEAKHLSEAQKRAFILADNRTGEQFTSWDVSLLESELLSLQNMDFDISGIMDFGDVLGEGFEPDLPEPGKESEEKFELIVSCEDDCEKEELFHELKNRGMRVRG